MNGWRTEPTRSEPPVEEVRDRGPPDYDPWRVGIPRDGDAAYRVAYPCTLVL